ncbi:hypothetical protein F5Y16DRAFT_370265 [Xylariaceae sp. FL0255]|nr:hypothetical protein F5Y16DRAFT_370265 [Xylariaceae sp. FL0255]
MPSPLKDIRVIGRSLLLQISERLRISEWPPSYESLYPTPDSHVTQSLPSLLLRIFPHSVSRSERRAKAIDTMTLGAFDDFTKEIINKVGWSIRLVWRSESKESRVCRTIQAIEGAIEEVFNKNPELYLYHSESLVYALLITAQAVALSTARSYTSWFSSVSSKTVHMSPEMISELERTATGAGDKARSEALKAWRDPYVVRRINSNTLRSTAAQAAITTLEAMSHQREGTEGTRVIHAVKAIRAGIKAGLALAAPKYYKSSAILRTAMTAAFTAGHLGSELLEQSSGSTELVQFLAHLDKIERIAVKSGVAAGIKTFEHVTRKLETKRSSIRKS